MKFGNDVKLKASVDVDASLFIWLKKNHPRNRFEILRQTRKSIFGQMRKDSFHMKRFSRDDEGHYQLIVATKKTVGRRTFELQSGKRNHPIRMPLKYLNELERLLPNQMIHIYIYCRKNY